MTSPKNTVHSVLNKLPALFAINLHQFSAISLTGEERSKYLQGQVTCDVNSLADHGLLHGGHCDAKGKVYAIFRLVDHLDAHLLMQSKQSIPESLAALQKFGVFAKVDIKQADELSFAAIVGENAQATLHKHFANMPDSLTPVVNENGTTIVYIAGQQERYMLIAHADKITTLLSTLSLPIVEEDVWNALEIQEGFPVLSDAGISQYVPQMLNLQAIHGISFTKGCYLGQETVARMQYLGKNKRALYTLTGQSDININNGDILEKQLGDNWRKAGDIIANYQGDNNQYLLQAVLANDIEPSAILRLKNNPDSSFTLVELPYSLTQ